MKNLYTTLFFVLYSISFSNAQWFLQNSGTTKTLHSIYFSTPEIGWAVGDSGTVLETTDGGYNWIHKNINELVSFFSISFVDINNGWIAGNGFNVGTGVIYKTTNGGVSWQQKTIGVSTDIYSIFFLNSNYGWAAGDFAILRTTDGGETWNSQSVFFFNSIYFIDQNLGWVVGETGQIKKTTNSGLSWVNLGIDLEDFSCVKFYNSDVGWVSGREGRVWKTTNGGINWSLQIQNLNQSFYSIDLVNENTVWLSSDSGVVYYSLNSGADWQIQQTTIDENLFSIFFINNNTGWVVGEKGRILKTINSGLPVELLSFKSSVENQSVRLNWITATEVNNAGFEVERKRNENWQVIGYVQGNGSTTEPKLYSFIDEDLLLGSYQYRLKQLDYNGTFEYSNIIEVEIDLPTGYTLSQNFPNPFNPNTKIRWGVPTNGYQSLIVYDILGNIVEKLVDEFRNAGQYEIGFSSSNLASGIYYYRLTSGEFIETRKMLLMK